MTDLLLKAVFQKQLTPDTVEIQFCSDWLKDQITDLFTKISLMEEELKWRRGVHIVTGVDKLNEQLNAYKLLLEESSTGRIILFEQLQEAKDDALKFGRAMEEERNLRLAFQEALEKLSVVDDTGTGGYMEDVIGTALSLLEKRNV
jgi:hypothetical protein